MNISCIVLAGGKGLRLGRDKTLEAVGDGSLLRRVVSNVAFLDSEVIVVTATESVFPKFHDYPKLRLVADTYPGKGPLGGIYTGLVASHTSHNLVVACDMPFLNQDLLRFMIQVMPEFDMVVPRIGSNVEPLHAIYSRACLPVIERMLKEGNLSVHRLPDMVKTRFVEVDEIDRFDPLHLSFFNINTEADLKKAKQLLEKKDAAISGESKK
ncbi:MAG: molybdenum cofactor guanylyltransferase [Chloroflexi bacterium]|nr:molybdenum cofactor guanylyltransferase [Chloroflexota bacterium]